MKTPQNKNTISYDQYIKDKLQVLHDMLGVEITDVATGAMQYGFKFSPEAKEILKTLSEVTSDFSVALMESKNSKKDLTSKEQGDYDDLKKLTEYLGNLQFKLNKIIQKAEEFKTIAKELQQLGLSCAEYVMEAQGKFREISSKLEMLPAITINNETADEAI